LSQSLKGHQINLGIEGGGVETAVPQQVGNVGKRSALAKHLSSEGVTEQMGTRMRGINAGSFKSPGDKGRDGF
jgi:hypothetical protein